MALFKQVVDAYVATKDLDQSALSRLGFWVDELGDRELATVTAEGIDAALVKLAARGRLHGGKRSTAAAGKPLAGSTMNRYLTQAGSIFKHAKRMKLVPRAFVAPTRGIERTPERANPERYLSADEVNRLVAVARVVDRHWGKMAALIVVAYHTGLRVGSLLAARGKHLDLATGSAHHAAYQERRRDHGGGFECGDRGVEAPAKSWTRRTHLRQQGGKAVYLHAALAANCRSSAARGPSLSRAAPRPRLPALARAGVSQQMIMKSMGHRTLTASARYAHASIEDKKAVIAKVFG